MTTIDLQEREEERRARVAERVERALHDEQHAKRHEPEQERDDDVAERRRRVGEVAGLEDAATG